MKSELFLAVVRGRIRLVFWVFFVTAAMGTVVTFWIPKQYSANALILLDTRVSNAAPHISGSADDERFLREQVAFISSNNMAQRVIDVLGLDKSTEAREIFAIEERGVGTLRSWLAETILRKVKVKPVSDGNLIEIEFTSVDPRLSSAVANAFVQSYTKAVADNQGNASKRQILFVQKQLADLRDSMSKLEKNIYDLQQKEEYFALSERYESTSHRVKDLEARLASLPAKTSDEARQQLRTEFEAQQAKLADIIALQSKLKVLQSNLEAMQRSHDYAMQRVWQESFIEHSDAFAVVSLHTAEPTDEPSMPKLWINLPLSVLIGLILGVASALLAEVIDRRVRTEADVSDAFGLPLLATVNL